ncbi:MAG: tetratricopeptide repeat protein [Kiritimatiellia bacterium]
MAFVTCISLPGRCGVRGLAVLLCFFALRPLVVQAQADSGPQASVREIREKAYRCFGQGEFDAAIPEFENLIQIFTGSKDPTVRMGLEQTYYNLGLCYFFTANFPSSETSFLNYIKKYPNSSHTSEAYVYIADCRRLSGKGDEAIKAYYDALKRYEYGPDIRTDIYYSIAQCLLAKDDWGAARGPLYKAFRWAPDSLRRSRAATHLATAYLKTLSLEKIYTMVPFLLQRDSLAARSIAFNMAALEAGDSLFAEERYREAFWLHRLVFPHDEVLVRTESFLEYLQKRVELEKRDLTDPRRLMRLQEWVGETEAEIKAMSELENYDTELEYRIARGYMEAMRYREARELFLHLSAVGGKEKAEESLYLAFICSTRLLPWTRAYENARQYMEKYPDGQWYDEVTVMVGQMYAKEQNWPEVIRHLSGVLQNRPNHQSAAECLFLLGYAYFMEEQFDSSVTRFLELRKRFPGSELISGATYWTAMALMFNSKYEDAGKDFDELLARHPEAMYMEDATFRRAICYYATGQFDQADGRFSAFIKAHPDSKLTPEAIMTRGDIAGAQARIVDAVVCYQRAMEFKDDIVNIEHYNHCAFQAGQMLWDAKKFNECGAHYKRYIERNRPDSNIPLAVYWIGRTLIETGEPVGAARYYKDAVLKYGADRKQIGVDMILDEWVATTHRLPADQARGAWNELQQSLRQARSANDPVGELRLTRVLMFHPDIKPLEREQHMDKLLQRENITNACPAVLECMLDGAIDRNQTNLAVTIAQNIITEFTETDYALNARLFLARNNIELLRTAPAEKAKALREEAIRHLDVIRTVFASNVEAAQALLLLSRLYREDGKTEDADKCSESVLSVRTWAKYWPEALYGRGLCAEARKEFLKATAYYERIYVMYAKYRDWTAKAYLRRAECLHRAYEDGKARDTLQEMLKAEDLTPYPEYEQAKLLLSKLEPR